MPLGKPIQDQTIRVLWTDEPYSCAVIDNGQYGLRIHLANVRALADMLHDIADEKQL